MTLLEAVGAARKASTHRKGVGWTIPPREWVAVLAALYREKQVENERRTHGAST